MEGRRVVGGGVIMGAPKGPDAKLFEAELARRLAFALADLASRVGDPHHVLGSAVLAALRAALRNSAGRP